ncbi:patatin-like phospholipase family protein [Erwinia sp. S63]|uniref:patatin-like phospholipase family protein n=1 Tax=Erwinia sp. S63 TaxID=2769341 RepID=UPI0019092190|nr:patatin-like phospholipase family protein [Erwinia sp. S63]MBK0096199.1 patatin-like phospholipase family protein [Erwinia sp. S63]
MNQPMKVGLALSGGGAIGAYQVGVVRALAESGTEVHCIAGASIGALNGAILSSSSSLAQGAARMGEIWHHLGANEVLKVNKSAYLRLLTQYGFSLGLSPFLSKSGKLISTLMSGLGMTSLPGLQQDDSLLSDQPLIELMNRFLDPDALASGTPLYASLYPTEGGMADIIKCALAEFGVGKTQDSEFQHIQALPAAMQREALLASAALPLLFQSREINGKRYSDGGMGGWSSLQGNTPVNPLVEAGCNMVIVTHLSDGSLWDRHHFPDTTILEIRPQSSLRRNEGAFGGMMDLLGFTAENIDSWVDQGYRDTLSVMERIKAPLRARQALNASVTLLAKSESQVADSSAQLQNAMARLK